MSSLLVTVVEIAAVSAHPNADRLELATIGGWQVIVGKGSYRAGDVAVYVPIDSILPLELSDRLDVTKYLSKGRVRCAKLRGEPSFGLTIPLDVIREVAPGADLTIGENLAEALGITKYEPPLPRCDDAEQEHPLFVRYTNIENLRHYPDLFTDGEPVVATEKIHGTNSRVGIVGGQRVAGSHRLQRKQPGEGQQSVYWFPFSAPGVAELLESLAESHSQVILFGEVYGRVQSLQYGLPNGYGYRAFDLFLDGKYVGLNRFIELCRTFRVEIAPLVYLGPFSLDKIREQSEGPSLILGADHYREGVVVKPLVERTHEKLGGRLILKYVSDTYLFGPQEEVGDA